MFRIESILNITRSECTKLILLKQCSECIRIDIIFCVCKYLIPKSMANYVHDFSLGM